MKIWPTVGLRRAVACVDFRTTAGRHGTGRMETCLTAAVMGLADS